LRGHRTHRHAAPVIIRREATRDRDSVRAVHAAAFRPPGGGVAAEVRLVDELRADGDVVRGLSVVAKQGIEVVGHVVCSRGHIDGQPALGLGPLGVVPAHQRRGVGHALMHAVLAAADALDEPCVVLLGDLAYYSRFGFELAEPLGVLPQNPNWTEHFQLRRLTAWTETLRGMFRYAPAFDRL
jgi:putative acetyltransferase